MMTVMEEVGDDGDSDNGEGGGEPEPGEGEGGGDGREEGEGNEGGNTPNEFEDCVVPPGSDPGDIGC